MLAALLNMLFGIATYDAPAQTFNQIQFVIGTGADDLRGDSSATATLLSPTGASLQVVTLKDQTQGSWGNNTTHTVTATLNPALNPSAIGHIVITLTSHNGTFESDDNWNVQNVDVIVSNSGSSSIELASGSGNPLARLTGSQPSVTLTTLVSGSPGTFNQIRFVIGTGGDDLRGDSSATATLLSPAGATLQAIPLKDQSQSSWDNNTTHTVTAALNPALNPSAIGHLVITLKSHNSPLESDDNWNVQSVAVSLLNNGSVETVLMNSAGTPLARLTRSQPSLTLPEGTLGPPGTFNQIQFVIGTGGDDLRGDSSATATLLSPAGATLQVIPLKDQTQASWDNNTTHTITAVLNPALNPSAIGHIVITLTSHDSLVETSDNWDVQSVAVSLSNNGAEATALMNFSGTPLARLTGTQPNLKLPEGEPGPAGTFNQIQFVIGTGGDDLRGDSSAAATLLSPNGTTLQVIPLKNQTQGSWDNNTTHMVSVPLTPPRAASAIGHVVITLTSHDSLFETPDNWNVQSVVVILSINGVGQSVLVSASGNPLQRLTGSLPSLGIDNLNCQPNVLGPQPGTGRLMGFVDLHTHPLSNLAMGGKLLYGGIDVGSLLPTDPDCNSNVRAQSMQQALGHDNSTHGGPGLNLNPAGGGGDLGVQNSCGDAIREQVVHTFQTANGGADESDDAHGAPDFTEWPVWNDVTHQKMWVDWIRRSYYGGLRVVVALAHNNKTLGDMVAGPGDLPTDDKSSADLQLTELKAFVRRHSDFMEIAASSADLERIVRGNKLAVVPGVELDNLGNFNRVSPLTEAEISAEIDRLFNEGVRYIFPIHVLDNPFGGTAVYIDLFNYSNFREAGQWWSLQCVPNLTYQFSPQADWKFNAATLAKLGVIFNPPTYPTCAANTGQANTRGLTAQGQFAIKEMMRHGMLIDIDHMSDLSQDGAIAIAKAAGAGYPLNSGHSGLRVLGTGGNVNERSVTTNRYEDIGRLHGMAGIGSANLDAYEWVAMYQKVIHIMGPNAVAGFGTDTDGFVLGMPPRHAETTLMNFSGTPLARLTGSQPSLTLTPLVNGPPGTFNQIKFVIGTGDDDLRGDSSATATLLSPTGATLQVIPLKDQNLGSWDNNTTHTVIGALNVALHPTAIGHIVITLTSHNSPLESDDNWNVQSAAVSLLNNGAGETALISFSGTPLARLTGNQPNLTLTPLSSGPPGTFNQIQFVIGTGGDDLRGDSSATATLLSPTGATLQMITLKDQTQGSWDNNTTHTVTATLNPALSPSAIGHLLITLTSHNSPLESDDNWNVQSVAVSLLNNGSGETVLMNSSGAPLARLTGSQPSLTLPEAPPSPPGTFNQVQFTIVTGDDDLRGDSSATATLFSLNGAILQVITLKNQNQGSWDNNTTQTVTATLTPALILSAVAHIVITLTSHNSGLETSDNWNIQSVDASLSNNGSSRTELASASGNPLARLTGSQPSVTLTPAPIAPRSAFIQSSPDNFNQNSPGTFNQIQFVIGTGDDDLRGDSSATATLEGPTGSTLQVITLKNQIQGSWDNNTTHTITAALNPALNLSAIAHIILTLTSHDSGFETPDNWNVQSVVVNLSNNGIGVSSVQYDDSFPRSRLGTKWWDYNTDGVVHYGMLPDFLRDARTAPGGVDAVDNNLMYGADYFLQTWKKCETEKVNVH